MKSTNLKLLPHRTTDTANTDNHIARGVIFNQSSAIFVFCYDIKRAVDSYTSTYTQALQSGD